MCGRSLFDANYKHTTIFVQVEKIATLIARLPNGNLKIQMDIYNTITYELKPENITVTRLIVVHTKNASYTKVCTHQR